MYILISWLINLLKKLNGKFNTENYKFNSEFVTIL